MAEEEKKKTDRRVPDRPLDPPPDPTDEEARAAYLRRLRNEIEEGLYKVPADWIAEKILESELEK